MRRAAGVVVLAMVWAIAVPTALFATGSRVHEPYACADIPATSGDPGTSITYQYTWDPGDCGVLPTDSLTIQLNWQSPTELIGTVLPQARLAPAL